MEHKDPQSVVNFLGWVATGKEAQSLDEMSNQVREAVSRTFNPQESGMFGGALPKAEEYFWTVEVFPESVIVCRRTDYFRVPYVLQDGRVVLSDQMIPVVKVWQDKW